MSGGSYASEGPLFCFPPRWKAILAKYSGRALHCSCATCSATTPLSRITQIRSLSEALHAAVGDSPAARGSGIPKRDEDRKHTASTMAPGTVTALSLRSSTRCCCTQSPSSIVARRTPCCQRRWRRCGWWRRRRTARGTGRAPRPCPGWSLRSAAHPRVCAVCAAQGMQCAHVECVSNLASARRSRSAATCQAMSRPSPAPPGRCDVIGVQCRGTGRTEQNARGGRQETQRLHVRGVPVEMVEAHLQSSRGATSAPPHQLRRVKQLDAPQLAWISVNSRQQWAAAPPAAKCSALVATA